MGDKIPADIRVIEIHSSAFRVDQAILTGESVSVSKTTQKILEKDAVKQDQINIIFSVLRTIILFILVFISLLYIGYDRYLW